MDDLKTHLECHFSLERDSAIVLKDSVLNVDATQVNGYEVGQCINLLLAVADMLRQMDVPCNWAWAWGIPTRRLLPSLGDAPACLNPQGLLRQLLRMEDESNAQSPFLDSVFLNHFESLPCDRADRVLKLATDIETEMTAPQRLQLGERIIAALLASGLTQRARDAAKSLFAVCPENDLSTHSRQSTAALPPWQLRARWLLLRTASDRLGPKGAHVETLEKAFRAMALSGRRMKPCTTTSTGLNPSR
ncbi:hypothetical protein [Variovorax sp. RA8]|uniref:hypothetical protein n=1 Tax=Variovorax sp. (strain JCM 16519 / RA8) TaxID=662548 RepID=UPI0013A585DA|nr:hypothetical protein [Variovorax sp. RA8]